MNDDGVDIDIPEEEDIEENNPLLSESLTDALDKMKDKEEVVSTMPEHIRRSVNELQNMQDDVDENIEDTPVVQTQSMSLNNDNNKMLEFELKQQRKIINVFGDELERLAEKIETMETSNEGIKGDYTKLVLSEINIVADALARLSSDINEYIKNINDKVNLELPKLVHDKGYATAYGRAFNQIQDDRLLIQNINPLLETVRLAMERISAKVKYEIQKNYNNR